MLSHDFEQGCPDALADRCIDRFDEILHGLSIASHGWVEIYHRAAWTSRAETRGGRSFTRIGREDGVAVRFERPGGGATLFGAASGAGGQCVALAIGSAGPIRDPIGPPKSEAERLLVDRDGDGSLPSLTRLDQWLTEAASIAGTQSDLDSWVEVATTVETWVDSRGVRASRRRTRTWAMLQPPPTQSGWTAPVFLASRTWAGIDPGGWASLLADRRARKMSDRAERLAGSGRLFFTAEAAAPIASGIAGYLHGTQATVGASVGSGWAARDAADDQKSLFGGSFDDGTYSTHTTELADGRRILAGIPLLGSLRRPSFRDPPMPAPSNLRLTPPILDLEDGVPVATASRVHALGDEWVVEIQLLSDHVVWIRTDPRDLAARCLGGWGEHRASHHGVETPGLVFDGLGTGR